MERHDFVVVGTGAMGSAVLWHLGRRGRDAIGLDRFPVPHARGSSHGGSRILRLAYVEDPRYVPLVRRALELWRELEESSGRRLFHRTGSIDIGPADGDVVAASVASCVEHDLDHRVLAHDELAESVPAWRLPAGFAGNLQPDGGWLAPEACIGAMVAGADVRTETVTDMKAATGGVVVTTDRGAYLAGTVIVTAGAWIGELVPELAALAVPERQVVGWLAADDAGFAAERFPVFILAVDEGRFYGFPHDGTGVKLGRYHHRHERLDTPDPAPPAPADHELLVDFARRYLPALGPVVASQACMFTNTPDEHFVIDRHPSIPGVVVGSACSGHGFKFASAVGEVLADLAEDRSPRVDVAWLGLGRFAPAGDESAR